MIRRNSRMWSIPGFNKTRYEDGGAPEAEGSGNPPPKEPPTKTFTQDDVNKFVAEERRKLQAKNAPLIQELEQLRSSTRLSEEEKQALTARIDSLKSESLSKEQQLTREVETYKKKVAETETTLTKKAEEWQGRYAELLVTNEIAKAASTNDVYKDEQVLDLLKPRAKVAPVIGDDGKPTERFQVVIRFDDVDAKTGNPVVLELSPIDTVKRMKELPERFGNLFKSGVQAGVGKTKGSGPAGEPDVTRMTPTQYREYRKTRGF
jgi:chromosome condensin MukBEF ATPase and DNA-binding subunit MukB